MGHLGSRVGDPGAANQLTLRNEYQAFLPRHENGWILLWGREEPWGSWPPVRPAPRVASSLLSLPDDSFCIWRSPILLALIAKSLQRGFEEPARSIPHTRLRQTMEVVTHLSEWGALPGTVPRALSALDAAARRTPLLPTFPPPCLCRDCSQLGSGQPLSPPLCLFIDEQGAHRHNPQVTLCSGCR